MHSSSSESLQPMLTGAETQRKDHGISRLLLWSCLIFSVFSSICAIALLRQPSVSVLSRQRSQGQVLRRPNPYINLDRAYRRKGGNRLLPIHSFAHVLLQINALDQHRKFLPEEEREYHSIEGFIYPDDRHFVVSPETSTVVQIRHQDYGMENCTLELSTPDRLKTAFDPAVHINESTVIDIWILDNTREISRYDLWDYAPAREHLFTSVIVSRQGWNESRHYFHCPPTSFSTFEFACRSDDRNCHVEFWQRKAVPPNGIYLTQHDSLTC